MSDDRSENHDDEKRESMRDVELTGEVYVWAKDTDEMRRNFIFEHMANADLDGRILVQNMQMVDDWIRTGQCSAVREGGRTPSIRAVGRGNS